MPTNINSTCLANDADLRVRRPHDAELCAAAGWPLSRLLERANALRDEGHGAVVSYSRKVFIPLTRLCRDVCHYCSFATTPRQINNPYLSPDEVLAIARAGRAAGCDEALFTLGDKPELRWSEARAALVELGYPSTVAYLAAMCELVLTDTGLLPHANPGVMTRAELALLRRSSVSLGIMLESASARLCERGGPHFGSPDKHPAARLATIRAAGELAIPFTSGLLIGIGETREERIDTLLALRDLHLEFGHIQEIIVQNFRAKQGTKMALSREPETDELAWTIAMARIVFGSSMNIQAPPNLSPTDYARLIGAGINDWGGVSPVTPDHVNPEAPWPQIEALRDNTARAGKTLVARLPSYPVYCRDAARWHDAAVLPHLLERMDADGFARTDSWTPGRVGAVPRILSVPIVRDAGLDAILARAAAGERLNEADVVALFSVRGGGVAAVCAAADELRHEAAGEVVRYVVNRNINYTNVCHYGCRFCAFSKGRHSVQLRGAPYDLAHEEIARRVTEAWDRGATEVCMQGGIHPDYTGATYLRILKTVKTAAPDMHVHAFSPLEVSHGAATLGLSVAVYLERLKEAGLGTLPGTAAEILDDEARAVLCPDKLSTAEWLSVMEAAHSAGLRSTATIMFGHIDNSAQWARHLLRIRDLQARTGGFTEFVPLPFVHMEAPLYLKGRARRGPTWREVLLMHAVARLVLHPLIPNIQASWVKLGPEGVPVVLQSGANDLGGTLMNESISYAAGNQHGQEFAPAKMEALIARAGRVPAQRTTLYADVPAERRTRSFAAATLSDVVLTPLRRRRVAAVPI
ncbi:MAG: 5-amino-6-(D-ribitylamino)uracil--L-tyrosine 4-hydroxyphenyl transferase CofH [Burkholderiales bacterium]|nr:5-amino-6-(D-ribitylamino)uracil--L-tyrosine 4-hydroxyphenyl transferase CofH [Burkholderiales bacterium]